MARGHPHHRLAARSAPKSLTCAVRAGAGAEAAARRGAPAAEQPAPGRRVAITPGTYLQNPVLCAQAQALKHRRKPGRRVAIHTIALLPGVPLSH